MEGNGFLLRSRSARRPSAGVIGYDYVYSIHRGHADYQH